MNKADQEAQTGERSPRTCRNCRVGTLKPRQTTYARWHGEHFIVLPNILAWRCDFCGETAYDRKVLAQLGALLGPDSGLDREGYWLLDAEGGDDISALDLGGRHRTDPSK